MFAKYLVYCTVITSFIVYPNVFYVPKSIFLARAKLSYIGSVTDGDVISAYLDLDSTVCSISYTKSGVQQVSFNFDKNELRGKALFPCVFASNCKFSLNFGQKVS